MPDSRSLSGDVCTARPGTSRKPTKGRGGARRTLCGQHGPDQSGVAGRKPNRLRGLSVEGQVPQSGHRGKNPRRRVKPRSSGDVRHRENHSGKEKEITAPTHALCPNAGAAAIPVEYSDRIHTDQNPAPCFNLRRCRSHFCGKGRRAGSGPLSTSKDGRKQVSGVSWRSSLMSWVTRLPKISKMSS